MSGRRATHGRVACYSAPLSLAHSKPQARTLQVPVEARFSLVAPYRPPVFPQAADPPTSKPAVPSIRRPPTRFPRSSFRSRLVRGRMKPARSTRDFVASASLINAKPKRTVRPWRRAASKCRVKALNGSRLSGRIVRRRSPARKSLKGRAQGPLRRAVPPIPAREAEERDACGSIVYRSMPPGEQSSWMSFKSAVAETVYVVRRPDFAVWKHSQPKCRFKQEGFRGNLLAFLALGRFDRGGRWPFACSGRQEGRLRGRVVVKRPSHSRAPRRSIAGKAIFVQRRKAVIQGRDPSPSFGLI